MIPDNAAGLSATATLALLQERCQHNSVDTLEGQPYCKVCRANVIEGPADEYVAVRTAREWIDTMSRYVLGGEVVTDTSILVDAEATDQEAEVFLGQLNGYGNAGLWINDDHVPCVGGCTICDDEWTGYEAAVRQAFTAHDHHPVKEVEYLLRHRPTAIGQRLDVIEKLLRFVKNGTWTS